MYGNSPMTAAEAAGSVTLPSFVDPSVSRATHPGFETHSIAKFKRHLAMFDRDAELNIDDPATFSEYRHRVIKLADITLSLSSIIASGAYQLRFSPRDEYCLSIPLNAYGSFAQGPGPAVLIGPNQTIHKSWHESSNFVAVHVPADVFERHVAPHNLSQPAALSGHLVKPLLQLIMITFTNTVDGPSAMVGEMVGASLDTMILALLDQVLRMKGTGELLSNQTGGTPYLYLESRASHARESVLDIRS